MLDIRIEQDCKLEIVMMAANFGGVWRPVY